MYKDFFGLDRNPFQLSPDPSFKCATEKSNAALGSIMYAITNRKGFVVMTGDVGTGKTLLVRSLFECWKGQGIAFANIFAPKLPVIDFLIHATSEFGIQLAEPTKGNLLRAFYGFLVTQFQKGLTTVLVIDEAHQLPTAVLEEVRMLTNVETNQQKLIQVLLVGQPELDRKLDSYELRQLKQRIAIRCRLEPLTTEETNHYINCRLALAGAKSQANTIFPTETVEVVHRYSRGIPRLINSICDHALSAAYNRQLTVVPVEIIEQVASVFRLDPAPDPRQTETPLSPADQTEKSAPVESRQAGSALNPGNMEAADPHTNVKHVNADNRTPVQTPSPSKAETSNGGNRCDIPGIVQTEHGNSTPGKPYLTASQDTNRSTAPNKTRSTGSTLASAQATKSIFPKPTATQNKVGKPAIDQTAVSVPRFRGSRFLLAAAAVAVAAAVPMARRQGGALMVPSQVADAWQLAQIEPTATSAAAAVQPAETISAIEFNDGSGDRVAAQRDGELSKSVGPQEHLLPRTKNMIAMLPRPLLKPPQLPTFNEPPLNIETPTNEFPGNGLPGISVPAPAPPAVSIGGNLQPPKLVSSPQLAASTLDRKGKMQGVAIIDAIVDATGKVIEMRVISGFPPLTEVAMDALRTWKYEPGRLNGQPIAMHMKVTINFGLP
jgi:general secretion pathway protein A